MRRSIYHFLAPKYFHKSPLRLFVDKVKMTIRVCGARVGVVVGRRAKPVLKKRNGKRPGDRTKLKNKFVWRARVVLLGDFPKKVDNAVPSVDGAFSGRRAEDDRKYEQYRVFDVHSVSVSFRRAYA